MNNFDENGNYNKTEWKDDDLITADKLNKIEEALETINENDKNRHEETDNRLDVLEERNKTIEDDLNNKADKEHTHNQYLTEHQSLEEYSKKTDIPTKISQLTNDKNYATETYVQNKMAETITSNLPEYWKNRLDEIGTKIETLQMENGMDTLQFLWCSDIHGVPGTSPSNTTYIGDIGRYLMDKHNIPFFVASGDIMSQASHADIANIWAEYDKLIPMLSPISNEEFLAIRGNHDGMWGLPMEYNGQANQHYHSYIGDKALFNAFMRRQTLDRYKRVFGKDGMYFYVDYHNYRIYLLNGHTFGDNSVNAQGQAVYNGFKHPILGSEQIQWVADTLMTVKENQQVIFICHAQLNQQLDFEVFHTMLNHYKNRTNGSSSKSISETYWGTNPEYANIQVNFDFSNAKGNILGWFNGHIHSDSIKTDLFDNLPIFTITTAGGDVRDTYYTNGTLTRTKGTATETAIDVVTVTSDYVYFTRIGSGYDRKYNRATKEVTIDYDSAFIPGEEPDTPTQPEEPDTPTQGEITSEVTWEKDKRLSSSSGNYSSTTGAYASSDIACSNGDVIRLYNVSKGTNYNYAAAYGSSYLGFIDLDTAIISNQYITASRVDSVITITIQHDSVTYIRVCSNGGIDPSTVRITINMEL